MADDLTLRSAGNEGSVAAARAGASGAKKESPEAARMRAAEEAIANLARRRGLSLSEGQIQELLKRRQAAREHQHEIAASAKAFEVDRGKESVTARATDPQAKTEKATGTREARTADGLSQQQRAQVRGNPDAGPVLPPATHPQIAPEQAKSLLTHVFDLFHMPQTLQDYAASLQQRPATAPGQKPEAQPQQPRPPAGTTLQATRSDMTGALGQNAQPTPQQVPTQRAPAGTAPQATRSDVTAGQTTSTAQTALGQQAPANQPRTTTPAREPAMPRVEVPVGQQAPAAAGQRPAPAPTNARAPATPGLPVTTTTMAATASALNASRSGLSSTTASVSRPGSTIRSTATTGATRSTSIGTRGLSTSVRAPEGMPREITNGGGGLISETSFDGLNFNWDAFYVKFMMKFMQDSHKARRLFKELQYELHKLAVEGIKAQISLTKMRQAAERAEAGIKLGMALGDALDALQKSNEQKKDGAQQGQQGQQAGQAQQPGQQPGQRPGQTGQQPGSAQNLGREAGQQPGATGQQPGAAGQQPGAAGQTPGAQGQTQGPGGQQQGPQGAQQGQQGKDKAEEMKSNMKAAAKNLLDGLITARQLMAENTESANQDVIAGAKRMRAEVGGAISSQMMEAQGMINQLVQLMGMARTR